MDRIVSNMSMPRSRGGGQENCRPPVIRLRKGASGAEDETMSVKWSGALAATAVLTALVLPFWPAGAAGNPGGWDMNVSGGLSEARAVGDRGGRLVMSCATYGGSSLPRYSIRLEGPAHGGRPLKAQLDIGPTHLYLALAPTTSPTTSAWTARDAKDQRAYRGPGRPHPGEQDAAQDQVGPLEHRDLPRRRRPHGAGDPGPAVPDVIILSPRRL